MSDVPTTSKQFDEVLRSLRDVPIPTGGTNDRILSPTWTFVMDAPIHDADGLPHWFCPRAGPVISEAAVFLTRLFAYNNPKVDAWKERLAKLLRCCPECVKGLQDAKLSSRSTYFGAFQPTILDNFWQTFCDWELKVVLEALSKVGIQPYDSTRTLADAPPAVLYHILSNPVILNHADLRPFVSRLTAGSSVTQIPMSPPPVGLFYLLVNSEDGPRSWARDRWKPLKVIHMQDFDDRYRAVFAELIKAVEQAALSPILHYSNDPTVLWSGLAEGLRHVPAEYLISAEHVGFDVRQVVTGHLYDTGPHLESVLKCLVSLLARLGHSFWDGKDPTFPQVVFDAVKDNDAYVDLLQSTHEGAWSRRWFGVYLRTFAKLPVWSDVFAKTINLLCDEAQHERFKDVRPQLMLIAAKLLNDIVDGVSVSDEHQGQKALSSAFSVHKDRLVAIAFGRDYGSEQWQEARIATRTLIKAVLRKDIIAIADDITRLARLTLRDGPACDPPKIHVQLWVAVYESVHSQDEEGVAMLVDLFPGLAHADKLTPNAFKPAFERQKESRQVFDVINRSVEVFHRGFRDTVVRFADGNQASRVASMLRRPGFTKEVIYLLMSPLEDLQVAGQALISQAFDVDGRLECFRALLQSHPHGTFEGICGYISTFVTYVPSIPEGCSAAKSLVRCLTDVIEVLCSGSDGLLRRDMQYLRNGEDGLGPSSHLPTLWSLMSKAISLIFKMTPHWSSYFPPEEMVIWMRDALIFGRDMLGQRTVIESAILSSNASLITNTKKLSQAGKQMILDLQQVLPELVRWLRLTDFELLHQSFSLLETLLDCFRSTGIAPDPSALAKLNAHVESGRKANVTTKTKLDAARLAHLEEMLVEFDDEVEILDTPPPPKTEKPSIDGKLIQVRKPTQTHKPIKAGQPIKQAKHAFRSQLMKDTRLAAKFQAVQRPGPSKFSASSSTKFTKSDEKRLQEQTGRPALPMLSKASTERSLSTKSEGSSRAQTSESSASESEEDDEEGVAGLKALKLQQTSPKVKKTAERRQVKMMDDAAVGLKSNIHQRLNRREDARRSALRLKPDITSLHRIILSWDYDHQGDVPPNYVSRGRLGHVPDVFNSYDHYRSVFEHLLLLECWAQLAQSKDEPRDQYECKITSRAFVDDWSDLEFTIAEAVKKEWFLGETDIVLLKNITNGKSILAKVQHYRATLQGIQGSLRCYLGGGRPDPGLQANTMWYISRIFSLSTLHREYAALVGLEYYDFLDDILRPHLIPRVEVDEFDVKSTMATYSVNEPQAKAILGALKTDNFSLIQGPPGTGKTTTICSLVNAFLAKHRQPTAVDYPGRNNGPTGKLPKPKILICAPSNAAIDELASRLKDKGPSVVRVGADKAINVSVKDISLDVLVDQKLSDNKIGAETPKEVGNQVAALRQELDSVRVLRQQKEDELAQTHDNVEKSKALDDEIRRLKQKRMTLTQQMDKLKDKQRDTWRTLDGTRRRFRSEVLQEADVICSTLSGSGHELLEQFDSFDMVVIDEAAQAIELSSLIPLKYRIKRCVMVGDPQQLPPTVLSQEARKYGYDQSLFVRLQKQRPETVHLLSIQYRMHPEISSLPSEVFYSKKLLDGPGMDVKTEQPWHTNDMFGPYRFFNIARGQEASAISGSSLLNRVECQVAAALYNRLQTEFRSVNFDFRIGVVSMYRAQVQELRRTFQGRFGEDIIKRVDFNTVDGFQGQEKDIIILSCVRATTGGTSVGFLADQRRMNVALTRARSSLFILGHAPTLERSDDTWKGIVNNAKTRAHLFDADVEFFARPSMLAKVPPPIKKLKRKASSEAVPTELMKPGELKALIARKPSVQNGALTDDMKEVNKPPMPAEFTASAPASPSIAPMDIEQPNSNNESSTTAKGQMTVPPPKAKPPPPRKRPKPETSLFVPKKPMKRP